jgi:hypothetical protein|tara:strand:+ start:257 stop:790 length:534 start_codon:yes stop_codon:yes gene_type:complete
MFHLVLVYAYILVHTVTGAHLQTVNRYAGGSDSNSFVKELRGIGHDSSVVVALATGNITTLFQLADATTSALETCGFSQQNAAQLLKQAQKLKRYGDGQIKKFEAAEAKLKKKVEKKKDRVYTPFSLAPGFSFYDQAAEHCCVLGNYETAGVNLRGDLRKMHTDLARGENYRKFQLV